MLDVASPQPTGTTTDAQPLVAVERLSVLFPVLGARFWSRARPQVHAVEDVSFTLHPGETLGLVGESGSGKTTTGRALILQIKPTHGDASIIAARTSQTPRARRCAGCGAPCSSSFRIPMPA